MAYSYPTIQRVFDYCPVPLKVTSTKRDGNFDHHDFGNAVDFAAIYGTMPRLQADVMMRDAAKWWYQFSRYLLELIHTTPFDTDNGFYVKNSQRVGAGFYGAATEAAHLDHVHVAMTYSSANMVLAGLHNKYGNAGPKRTYRGDGSYYYSSVTTPTPVPVPAPVPANTYVVKPGDTLSLIAEKYNTTVAEIMRINPYQPGVGGLPNPNVLGVGWRVKILDPALPFGPGTYHRTVAGDTIWELAQKYGTTVEKIMELNPHGAGKGLVEPPVLGVGWLIKVKE